MIDEKIRVLMVEDSLPDARYVQRMLSAASYSFAHATTLAQAHDQIMSENIFDVIVLDLSLPDETGIATFVAMFGWVPTIPIIILTGLDDEEISMQAVKMGAQDYVLKQELNAYNLSRGIRYAIERKQTEENTKRLAILEQNEEFMATLTHDLKNPLIGANRILELMAEQVMGVVSPEQASLLLKLRDSNKLLLSMIQNLIEVYRFEKDVNTVRLENTNVLQIVTSCISDIEEIAQHRDIQLNFAPPDFVRDVLADKSAIRRVVQNLLDNALKFTPTGGQISLFVRSTNGNVEVKIEDSGPGISVEEQTRLFQRFSQGRAGKNYSPGTGLGLYLCKQIVNAHHGDIRCTSTEGLGATFVVTIPAA